jgi:hypothetical protein
MLNGKLSLLKRGLATGTAAFLIASAGIHSARADVITEWNAIAANLPIAAPPVMARVMAAMHGAMHDAVNSIDPHYQHYRFPVPAPAGASIDAAAAVAAHCVLVSLVPGQTAVLDAALAASLAKIPDGESKVDGIAVGMRVAMKMLDWLSKDGFDAKAADKPGNSFSQIEREIEGARAWGGAPRPLDRHTESTGLSRKIGAYAIASHMRPR